MHKRVQPERALIACWGQLCKHSLPAAKDCTVTFSQLTPLSAQIERNLDDAMHVARNVVRDPRLVPGGGAVEMAVSRALMQQAESLQARLLLSCSLPGAAADELEAVVRFQCSHLQMPR